MAWWRLCLVLSAFVGMTSIGSGCAGRQTHERQLEQPASIERPARAISDEQDWADKTGEVAVVVLVVLIFVGGIVGSMFALGAL